MLTPEQTKHKQPINPTSVRHLLDNNHDDAIHYKNSLLKTSKSDEVSETYLFPTPQNPGNEKEHTPIQTRILNGLRELEQLEQLNPLEDIDSGDQFLSYFDWTDSTLQPDVKQAVGDLLVEFHDYFAQHHFDIGINTEFKVQLTPLDNRLAFSQRLPAPINLKDDLLVQPELLHKYGITVTLPFDKYASPIFAQRKPNGKLRLLVDLRKLNTVIADDYINNNHPVSTSTDAAQPMAGKKLVLQAWLFPGVSLPPNGQPATNRTPCFQFSTSQVELPDTEDWHKDIVVPCSHFRASYVNISIQSWKPITLHNTPTILA